MLAGLAGWAPASVCASIGTRRGCPWTNGSPVNSHQSSGSRTSARNDQPPADTEATATSGRVGVAAAALVGNNEGQQARHNRNSSSADRSGRVRQRGQTTPFRKPIPGDPPPGHSQPAVAWRCETAVGCGRDLTAVCGRLVRQSRSLRRDRSAGTSHGTAHAPRRTSL
jgi:hypothetical protein